MGVFTVGVVEGRFVVHGPGSCALDANAFVVWLAAHGRGSYTQRSTTGSDRRTFLSWLERHGIQLAAVDRRVIAEYIVAFRVGAEDGLALGRQPQTVNHRLGVLASFFAFLDGCSGDAAGRPSPVPASQSVMEGSHGMPGRDLVRRGGWAARRP